MSKQNKDRLEEFFIKGTQNYQFEYDEKDWLKLEKKLEQVQPKPLPFWRNNGLYLLSIPVVLIILATIWFWPDDSQLTQVANPKDKVSKVEEKGSVETSQIKDDQSGNDLNEDISVSEASVPENKTKQSGLLENASVSKNEINETNDSSLKVYELTGSKSPDEQSNKQLPNVSGSFDQNVNDHFIVTENIENEHSRIFTESESLPLERSEEAGYGHNDYQVSYLIPVGLSTSLYEFDPVSIEGIPMNNEIDEEPVDLISKESDEIFRPAFSIGVTLSPDLSSVGIENYSKPGTRLGLLLTGSLSNKFSIRSGAILTHNIYSASGDQYNPNVGGYSGWISPESAEGECKLIDIPLSVRYDIIQKNRSRWFLVGGLSTYIMLKEEYQFDYNNPPQNAMDSWQSDKASAHVLGLINLSAGYEHFLAPRWSVQVEPFVNIPITGIGWGNVDLYTFGAYFTLKRHFYRKKIITDK